MKSRRHRAKKLSLAVRRVWEKADAWRGKHKHKATCQGKGCNSCCLSDVMVSRKEAEAIVGVLTPAQRTRVIAAPRNPEARCPLLSTDGGCGIYHFRPTVCRLYMVTSDPACCVYSSRKVQYISDAESVALLPRPEQSGLLVELLKEQVAQEKHMKKKLYRVDLEDL